MAFDAVLGRVVLFGGADATSTPRQLSDVWDWDGTTWTERTPAESPAGRQDHAVAYDEARQRLVMFGGQTGWWQADTWELMPIRPARSMSFGQGCAGTAGSPVLLPSIGHRPWLGDSFQAEVINAPAGRPAVLFSGSSRTNFAGLTLPFDLTALGMPGCTLWCSGQILLPMTPGGGPPSAAIQIPLDPALAGGAFYQQALVVDPGANTAGLTATQGLEHRFGVR
jgi:hypothetical protein